MRPTIAARAALAPVAVAAGVLVAGCGSDPADGRQLFIQTGCASCHVLADAGGTGTMGPNLDQAQPSAERVRQFVVNGGNGMPPLTSRLDDDEIDAVAEYVEEVAGTPRTGE